MTSDLVATCWTSAGNVSPLDASGVSPVPVAERVRAVADTGWAGIGFAQDDLFHIRDTVGFGELRRMIDDAGLTHTEIELIEHWWIPRGDSGHSYHVRDMLLAAADVLAPAHIKVGSALGTTAASLDPYLQTMHDLAEQAVAHGTRIAIEPMPFSAVSSIPMGADLVRAVDHSAFGLIVDAWHVFRAGTTLDELGASLTAEMIFGVELNDAHAHVVGTLFEDTVNNRLFPGEGAFDVAGLVDLLRELGYEGRWGVEILSKDFRALPYLESLTRAFDTGRRAVTR